VSACHRDLPLTVPFAILLSALQGNIRNWSAGSVLMIMRTWICSGSSSRFLPTFTYLADIVVQSRSGFLAGVFFRNLGALPLLPAYDESSQ